MNKSIAECILYVLFYIPILFLSSCIHKRHIDKKELFYSPQPPTHALQQTISTHMAINNLAEQTDILNNPTTLPPITIWVHGTLLFSRPDYHHVFQDMYRLMPALTLPPDNFFNRNAHIIAHHDPENFPLETFYFFGWPGKLHAIERKMAAEKLYNELAALIKKYKEKYGVEPVIRIIAHSHGGNLVLYMAKIKTNHAPLAIDSLILLACPVQDKTMNLINSPMFKRIYSLYSSLDIIQILAPQLFRRRTTDISTNKRKRHYKFPPFSSRLFPQQERLTQVKIKINNYPISHASFSMIHFTQMLPLILKELDMWHTQTLLNNTCDKYKLLCIHKTDTPPTKKA